MTLFPEDDDSVCAALAPFQSEAVEEILEMLARRGAALLADGPGLGKSWVAASVARNWEKRGGSSELVVPASLVGQWREVAARFGLAAAISSHDACSPRSWHAASAARLVIVDEAHRFRNSATRRYRSLSARSRRASMLLVTATPVCNSAADLRALLGLMVADDALADRGVPSLDEAFHEREEEQLRAALDEVAIARDQGVLPSSLRFAATSSRAIGYRPAGRHEAELFETFEKLRFPLAPRAAAGMLRAFLWRRLESSAAALEATLGRLRKLHARALECATRGVVLNRAGYRAAFGDPDAPVFQDILFPELWGTGRAQLELDAAEIRRELESLEEAGKLVGTRLAIDPKAAIVRRVVEGLRGQRGLVFTQSRDTARALWGALRDEARCGFITGSGCRDATGGAVAMDVVLAMLTRGAIDLIVATDVGCEGLNLQSASWVIHADLPWNPAKLEQRLGRVSRIGQQSSRVDEIVLVPETSSVVAVLNRKLGDAARLVPRESGTEEARGIPRLSGPLIAESHESRCVVELVERRMGRTSRVHRALGVDGRAGSGCEGRTLVRKLELVSVAPSKGEDSTLDKVVETWIARVRSRDLQPSRVDGASPQRKMLDAASRAGALTRELVDLMSRRYRTGTETLIADASEASVDERSVSALVRAIRGEPECSDPYDAAVAGSIVTRGWLRSAANRGNGPRI